MKPLIYGWNVYALLFWIVYIVWFVLEMIGAFAQRMRAGAEKQDRGSMVVLLVGLYGGLLLNFALPGLFPGATITWNRLFTLNLKGRSLRFGEHCLSAVFIDAQ